MSDQTQEVIVAYCGLVCTNCDSYQKGEMLGLPQRQTHEPKLRNQGLRHGF